MTTIESVYDATSAAMAGAQAHPEYSYCAFLSPANRSLTNVAAPECLRYVNLTRCHIANLEGLSRFASLQWLFLDDNVLEDVAELSVVPQLELCSLSFNPIRDASRLSSSSIQTMNLNDTGVSDLGFINNMPSLKRLSIQRCPVGDRELMVVKPHYNLEYLDAEGTRIADLHRVARVFPNIRALDLECSEGFAPVVTQNFMAQLKVFNGDAVRNITHQQITVLGNVLAAWFEPKAAAARRVLEGFVNDITDPLQRARKVLSQDMGVLQTNAEGNQYLHGAERDALENLMSQRKALEDFMQVAYDFAKALSREINYQIGIADIITWAQRHTTLAVSPLDGTEPDATQIASREWLQAPDAKQYILMKLENPTLIRNNTRKLLEEIEVVGKRVEFDPEKFRAHFQSHTTNVAVPLDRLQAQSLDELHALVSAGWTQRQLSDDSVVGQTPSKLVVFCKKFEFAGTDAVYCPLGLALHRDEILSQQSLMQLVAEFAKSVPKPMLELASKDPIPGQFNPQGHGKHAACGLRSLEAVPECAELDVSHNLLERVSVEWPSLEALDVSCNAGLTDLRFRPGVKRLDVSFTKLSVGAFLAGLDPAAKQPIEDFSCFGIPYNLNFVRAQLRSLKRLNGVDLVSRGEDCESAMLSLWELDAQGFNVSQQRQQQPEEQTYEKAEFMNSCALAPPLWVQRRADLCYLGLRGASAFQLKLLKPQVRYLDISWTSALLDEVLAAQEGLYAVRAAGCRFEGSLTQKGIAEFFIDSLQCTNARVVLDAARGLRNLKALSCRQAGVPEAYDLELVQALLETSPQIQFLNTMSGTWLDASLYFKEMKLFNGWYLSEGGKTTRLDQFSAGLSDALFAQLCTITSDTRALNLDGRALQSVQAAGGAQLRQLGGIAQVSMQQNRIRKLELPQCFPGLESMNLSQNQIQEFVFLGEGSKTLRTLVLRNNPIQILKKATYQINLPSLESLDLSGTRQCRALQSQSFAFLPSLRELRLDDCQFINISNDALLGLKNLQRLYMKASGLRGLEILDGLAQYGQLEELDISENKISTLGTLMKGTGKFQFKKLAFEGNPLCRTPFFDDILEQQFSTLVEMNHTAVTYAQRKVIEDMLAERERERLEQLGMVQQPMMGINIRQIPRFK